MNEIQSIGWVLIKIGIGFLIIVLVLLAIKKIKEHIKKKSAEKMMEKVEFTRFDKLLDKLSEIELPIGPIVRIGIMVIIVFFMINGIKNALSISTSVAPSADANVTTNAFSILDNFPGMTGWVWLMSIPAIIFITLKMFFGRRYL